VRAWLGLFTEEDGHHLQFFVDYDGFMKSIEEEDHDCC
jgi:hypothetical protein